MGGGGKKKTPKVDPLTIPAAATPAPPPEPSAQAPTVGGGEEGTLRHKDREAKKRGTSALRIDLNMNAPGAQTPGGGGGLNVPRG